GAPRTEAPDGIETGGKAMTGVRATVRSGVRLACVLALMLTAGACASTVRISDLLAEPQRYRGQTVRIEGLVVRAVGLFGTGGYEVDDGTGQIFVVTQGSGIPTQGVRTKAKGRFEPIFSFGGRSIAAIVQDSREEQ